MADAAGDRLSPMASGDDSRANLPAADTAVTHHAVRGERQKSVDNTQRCLETAEAHETLPDEGQREAFKACVQSGEELAAHRKGGALL